MKLLQDILYQVRIKQVTGTTQMAIERIAFDSREVTNFSLFVAIEGTQVDGHNYIEQSVESGAIAVVCEKMPEKRNGDVTYIEVDDAQDALGKMAANFYNDPSSEIELVGITGTNGKTTCATILYRLFKLLGKKAGLISTVENRIHNQVVKATHTTPDALMLNSLLRDMVDQGCSHCFMEVSSHALHQKRVSGTSFAGAVFTNITHEHLDYHKTFDDYIGAKKLLFDGLSGDAFALVNLDDKHGATMLQNCKAKTQKTFALKAMADFKAKVIENQFTGLHLHVDGFDLYTKLVGRFNAYNILTAYATALLLGREQMEVLTALSNINPVAGRFEYVMSPDGIAAIIDYAHTPDALKNVLKTVADIRTKNETVITVVGCGGNRDTTKRPQMARIACKYSDRVILTSDNPRFEDPDKIIEDMMTGVEPQDHKKVNQIANRREAIKMACSIGRSGDIILIAGKGHETYQEIKGERQPFDDLAIVKDTFKILNC
ncbi:MAG TPA: UDP-N-acetylmuramoyl-L-alanyl-D-glutamate--2,6-diaminopimelate ligase [Cryomorphaceae bacterium]|nr:UDP-N-acetylmuramoyl-L-alanyl-D-glutamate--2,6-diaminopimelate ligase [Cryomorphaceae bacterium]